MCCVRFVADAGGPGPQGLRKREAGGAGPAAFAALFLSSVWGAHSQGPDRGCPRPAHCREGKPEVVSQEKLRVGGLCFLSYPASVSGGTRLITLQTSVVIRSKWDQAVETPIPVLVVTLL